MRVRDTRRANTDDICQETQLKANSILRIKQNEVKYTISLSSITYTYCPFCSVVIERDTTARINKEGYWECQICHLQWNDAYKRGKNMQIYRNMEEIVSPKIISKERYFFYRVYNTIKQAHKARDYLKSIKNKNIKGELLIYDVKIIKSTKGKTANKYIIYKNLHKDHCDKPRISK